MLYALCRCHFASTYSRYSTKTNSSNDEAVETCVRASLNARYVRTEAKDALLNNLQFEKCSSIAMGDLFSQTHARCSI